MLAWGGWPPMALQEDPALLLYFDNALMRVGE
jgi:hypothetical protein